MTEARILVVDDSIDARKGLSLYLNIKGYNITEAESGEQAIELLKTNSYNLVVSDLKMQNIDGIGVLKEIKKLYPQTDVIIMTAYASIETAIGSMKFGACDYISKPINMEELKLLIERCLEKQRLVAEVGGLKEIVNLYEVSKGLNSVMDLEKLLELIIKLAADTLDAEGGSIMLLDEKADNLIAKAAAGKRANIVLGKKLKIGERIAGYATEKGLTVKIEGSIKDDTRFSHLERFDGVSSGITVPLMRKKKLLGVINLNRSTQEKGFSKNDTKLLTIFATQATIAIENSYLFNDIQHEKEKLNTIFSEMGSGAIITDEHLRITIINQEAKNFFDLTGNNCSGKYFADCIKDFKPSISLNELGKNREKVIMNFDLVKKKGNFLFLSVSASKIRDKNYVLVLRNITEEKKEEMVKKNFIRLMSHKLKTPLTSIFGFISALRVKETERKLNDTEKNSLKVIEIESLHLSSLVDKLLRFTLLETESLVLNKTTENLADILKTVIKSLDLLIWSSKVKINISREINTLPNIFVDKEKIQEVIENLVENAIKFNESDVIGGKETRVDISGHLTDNDFIQVEITDNGPGIPAEEHEKIFEKFQQLEKYFVGQVDGAGLGLPLARRIIESHGGKVWVEKVTDTGCKVILTLPTKTE